MVAGEGLRRFHALPAAAKPSGGDGRDRLRRAHHPIARMQLPDRQGRAHRGRHGSRMPPPEHVRQRRGRSDDERVRGPHGQDIRPDVGADSLSDGRLPPPAADRCGAGTHGGGLCRSGCVGDGQRRPQHPHRRREIHPRSPHRRRSVHRRGVDARNGTVCDGAHIGVDVKAYDFIAAEKAHIDNGSIVERCFVGESCRLDKAFTAAESLFSQTRTAKTGRQPRSSRVPTPSRTTSRRS